MVQDQLRVANGWVRCGRCSELFRALETRLVDERDAALPQGTGAKVPSATIRGAEQLSRPHAAVRPAGLPEVDGLPDAAVWSTPRFEAPGSPAQATRPVDAVAAWPDPEPAQAPKKEPALGAATASMPALDSDDLARGRRLFTEASLLPRAHPVAPRRRPSSAAQRWVWGSVAAGAAVALSLQALVAWHDQVAQAAPVLRPVVEVVCVMADCRVDPLRQLQALSVESSELVQLGGTVYQITIVLRSRAERELSPPAIDLKLTNAREEVVVRRVLRMSDFGLRGRSLAPRQELTLQAALNTGARDIVGYNIELFYP